jgi:predicted transglutaminase-like cysteine proteinase
MLADKKNHATYLEFSNPLRELKLSTVAEKAFAVDSLVDARIGYGDDMALYGEKKWATPIETVLNLRGDEEDAAILKAALMEEIGVERRDIFISISTAGKNPAPVTSVMVNVAGKNQPEQLVILDRDKKAKLTPLADKKYVYHIGVNKDEVRYITPPLEPTKP